MRRTAVMMNWPDRLKLMPKLLMTIGKISLGIKYMVASRHELIVLVGLLERKTSLPVEYHEEKDKKYSETKPNSVVGIGLILNIDCCHCCLARKANNNANAACHDKFASSESIDEQTIE